MASMSAHRQACGAGHADGAHLVDHASINAVQPLNFNQLRQRIGIIHDGQCEPRTSAAPAFNPDAERARADDLQPDVVTVHRDRTPSARARVAVQQGSAERDAAQRVTVTDWCEAAVSVLPELQLNLVAEAVKPGFRDDAHVMPPLPDGVIKSAAT